MSGTPSDNSGPFYGKRFLVVEDEFLIVLDIQNILETAGARSVVAANRVADALAALDESKPGVKFDAVVLDLRLDKDVSTPIAERLVAAGVPFIFLTGAPTEAGLTQQFSFAPVVGKPFDSATLLAALSKAMAAGR